MELTPDTETSLAAVHRTSMSRLRDDRTASNSCSDWTYLTPNTARATTTASPTPAPATLCATARQRAEEECSVSVDAAAHDVCTGGEDLKLQFSHSHSGSTCTSRDFATSEAAATGPNTESTTPPHSSASTSSYLRCSSPFTLSRMATLCSEPDQRAPQGHQPLDQHEQRQGDFSRYITSAPYNNTSPSLARMKRSFLPPTAPKSRAAEGAELEASVEKTSIQGRVFPAKTGASTIKLSGSMKTDNRLFQTFQLLTSSAEQRNADHKDSRSSSIAGRADSPDLAAVASAALSTTYSTRSPFTPGRVSAGSAAPVTRLTTAGEAIEPAAPHPGHRISAATAAANTGRCTALIGPPADSEVEAVFAEGKPGTHWLDVARSEFSLINNEGPACEAVAPEADSLSRASAQEGVEEQKTALHRESHWPSLFNSESLSAAWHSTLNSTDSSSASNCNNNRCEGKVIWRNLNSGFNSDGSSTCSALHGVSSCLRDDCVSSRDDNRNASNCAESRLSVDSSKSRQGSAAGIGFSGRTRASRCSAFDNSEDSKTQIEHGAANFIELKDEDVFLLAKEKSRTCSSRSRRLKRQPCSVDSEVQHLDERTSQQQQESSSVSQAPGRRSLRLLERQQQKQKQIWDKSETKTARSVGAEHATARASVDDESQQSETVNCVKDASHTAEGRCDNKQGSSFCVSTCTASNFESVCSAGAAARLANLRRCNVSNQVHASPLEPQQKLPPLGAGGGQLAWSMYSYGKNAPPADHATASTTLKASGIKNAAVEGKIQLWGDSGAVERGFYTRPFPSFCESRALQAETPKTIAVAFPGSLGPARARTTVFPSYPSCYVSSCSPLTGPAAVPAAHSLMAPPLFEEAAAGSPCKWLPVYPATSQTSEYMLLHQHHQQQLLQFQQQQQQLLLHCQQQPPCTRGWYFMRRRVERGKRQLRSVFCLFLGLLLMSVVYRAYLLLTCSVGMYSGGPQQQQRQKQQYQLDEQQLQKLLEVLHADRMEEKKEVPAAELLYSLGPRPSKSHTEEQSAVVESGNLWTAFLSHFRFTSLQEEDASSVSADADAATSSVNNSAFSTLALDKNESSKSLLAAAAASLHALGVATAHGFSSLLFRLSAPRRRISSRLAEAAAVDALQQHHDKSQRDASLVLDALHEQSPPQPLQQQQQERFGRNSSRWQRRQRPTSLPVVALLRPFACSLYSLWNAASTAFYWLVFMPFWYSMKALLSMLLHMSVSFICLTGAVALVGRLLLERLKVFREASAAVPSMLLRNNYATVSDAATTTIPRIEHTRESLTISQQQPPFGSTRQSQVTEEEMLDFADTENSLSSIMSLFVLVVRSALLRCVSSNRGNEQRTTTSVATAGTVDCQPNHVFLAAKTHLSSLSSCVSMLAAAVVHSFAASRRLSSVLVRTVG